MREMVWVMTLALVAGNAPTSVPFVLDEKAGVIVPATVGRLDDLRFLVDTGATRSVISESIAQQLGLPPVARTEVVTSAGSSVGLVVALPATCVASQCAEELLAIVMSQRALENNVGRVDGILGNDILSRGDFTIDYRRRRFEWGGGPDASRSEDRLFSSVEDGRAIVTAPQGAGRLLRLVADSGASGLIFFDGPRVRALPTASGNRLLTLQTLGHGLRAESMLVQKLRLGSTAWTGEMAAVVPRPPGYPETIDGLLPLHRFASVSFRHAEGAVVVRHR